MKDKAIAEVFQTTNYDQFVADPENRETRKNTKLLNNMAKNGFWTGAPIGVSRVGDNLMVHAGQHRIEYAKLLGIPVKYIVLKKDEVIAPCEESCGIQWSIEDHIESKVKAGNKHYAQLKEFKKETGLNYTACAKMLCGFGNQGSANALVRSGNFEIKSERLARAILCIIDATSKYADWSKNSLYIDAIIQSFVYANINLQTLYQKINSNPGLLTLQPTVVGFVGMIERVYNRCNRSQIDILHKVTNGIHEMRVENAKNLKVK